MSYQKYYNTVVLQVLIIIVCILTKNVRQYIFDSVKLYSLHRFTIIQKNKICMHIIFYDKSHNALRKERKNSILKKKSFGYNFSLPI